MISLKAKKMAYFCFSEMDFFILERNLFDSQDRKHLKGKTRHTEMNFWELFIESKMIKFVILESN